MAPHEFVRKWGARGSAYGLNERAGAQAHFLDLCRVLEVPGPDDPNSYCFERGVKKTGAGQGFADVWKRGHFAWEYKAPGENLSMALQQLMMYALPLENPPLLVVSDRLQIDIHTHFTGYPSERHLIEHEQLEYPEARALLRSIFTEPERFKPSQSSRQITEDAAGTFAATADRLRMAGVAPQVAAHFLTQCLFCFFAEDVELLPRGLFHRLVKKDGKTGQMQKRLTNLFTSMRDGGEFGADDIQWFNGGLFKTIDVPDLDEVDIASLRKASELGWKSIDGRIFGTLFERGLDPSKRRQLGAHYTDPETIMRLVEPVVERPLFAEWRALRPAIEANMAKSKRHGDRSWRAAHDGYISFLERLRSFRILDPACGSGNFLYLALNALKNVEHQVNTDAHVIGLDREVDLVTGPHNVLGIEVNDYAAELARVTVWIGELQWRIEHGYSFKTNPVLDALDHIECRDALLSEDGDVAAWPAADAVVGNPPFVGNKKMRGELGDAYFKALTSAYQGQVPGGADLVCYWFDKAWRAMQAGNLVRAGLVSTNSIRSGVNRSVLEPIARARGIGAAWGDEPWFNEGAAVRVSLVSFEAGPIASAVLNGASVTHVGSDLRSTGNGGDLALATANKLAANARSCFMGITKVGSFDIEGEGARRWLAQPNPNGRSSAEVLRPSYNGIDVTRRMRDGWIVDFGLNMLAHEAAGFEQPFGYLQKTVKAERASNNREAYRVFWWRHGEARPGLRALLAPLPRYIATPEVAKHRIFAFVHSSVLPDKNLQVVPRADDTTFGILHSRFHEVWSLRMGSSLEDRPRYTPTSCFETFPFPAGITPADTACQHTDVLADGTRIPTSLQAVVVAHAAAIARTARALNDMRERWLNPPEWTRRELEVVPLGMDRSPYPDRILARPGYETELAQRTLTKLYNERPSWLAQAHEALDSSVAAAYGWGDYSSGMPDEEVLKRLLALNALRVQQQSGAPIALQMVSDSEPSIDRIRARSSRTRPASVEGAKR